MRDNTTKREYTRSPWSGKAYKKPPTIDELTEESKAVVKSNPTISKAMDLDAMGRFIESYKAQHGIN